MDTNISDATTKAKKVGEYYLRGRNSLGLNLVDRSMKDWVSKGITDPFLLFLLGGLGGMETISGFLDVAMLGGFDFDDKWSAKRRIKNLQSDLERIFESTRWSKISIFWRLWPNKHQVQWQQCLLNLVLRIYDEKDSQVVLDLQDEFEATLKKVRETSPHCRLVAMLKLSEEINP